jgi:subtilase family serine protease
MKRTCYLFALMIVILLISTTALAQERMPDGDSIKNRLQAHGLRVNVDYTNGLLIDFSGTAGQVEEAFHTEIHNLSVKGVQHIANMSDPQIPAALAPAVSGVVSLHDFRPDPMYRPRAEYTVAKDGTKCYLVVPGDLATIYNLNPLLSAGISGQGQTIVVIEDTDVYATADWASFRSVFGLSSYTDGSFTEIHPAPESGTNNCSDPGATNADVEATIDAEYASATAPSAAIILASCADTTTFGGLIALQNLLNESGAPPALVSMSYGECEATNGAASNAAFNSTFQQAVAEGVSVFVSSGDGERYRGYGNGHGDDHRHFGKPDSDDSHQSHRDRAAGIHLVGRAQRVERCAGESRYERDHYYAIERLRWKRHSFRGRAAKRSHSGVQS